MATRHERARRDRDETTCDDDRPAALAAALACARCTCAAGATGLCAEHSRKRRALIRNSARRAVQHEAYVEHLITVGGNGRLEVLCDDDLAPPVNVTTRGVL